MMLAGEDERDEYSRKTRMTGVAATNDCEVEHRKKMQKTTWSPVRRTETERDESQPWGAMHEKKKVEVRRRS